MKSDKGSTSRLYSVDLLRGLAMILMALDHARDYFHRCGLYSDCNPSDLSQTSAGLFMTRWVTHICAPVFVFLAGTSAFLALSRGKTKSELSKFLLVRGLWLILLELTIVRFGLNFHIGFHSILVGVIWTLGWSMIVLAGLIFIPLRIMTALGVAMIALHNLFDPIQAQNLGAFGFLWKILHEGGMIRIASGTTLFISYPLLPWIGVMAVGYGFGRVLLLERDKRRQWLLRLGIGLTLAFIILRAANIYGDPMPWSVQKNLLFTIFSFMNTQKYPPSLLFLLMTLGPAIASLVLFDREPNRMTRAMVVFGRVPLFFYLVHIPFLHLIAVLFADLRYGHAEWLFWGPSVPADYGYSLPVVYLIWFAALLALYPVCRWFAGVKKRPGHAWLSYL